MFGMNGIVIVLCVSLALFSVIDSDIPETESETHTEMTDFCKTDTKTGKNLKTDTI